MDASLRSRLYLVWGERVWSGIFSHSVYHAQFTRLRGHGEVPVHVRDVSHLRQVSRLVTTGSRDRGPSGVLEPGHKPLDELPLIHIWLPERGALATMDEQGQQKLWTRSKIKGVWRPNEAYLDPAWHLVGRQEE